MSGQTQVKVLMLNFEYTDLDDLDKEALQVYIAFRSIGYEVEEYSIKMQDPGNTDLLRRLTSFLLGEGALRILYYHGHGAFSFQTGLQLCSHNYPDDLDTLQDHARIFWSNLIDTLEKREAIMLEYKQYQEQRYISWNDGIGPLIKDAEHQVLVILDCCYSGGSVASDDKKLHNTIQSTNSYAKELLLASSWGSKTSNRMSPALCEVLKRIKNRTLSIQELQENISNLLWKEGQKMEEIFNKRYKEFELGRKKLEQKRIECEAKKKKLLLKQRKLFDDMEDKKAKCRQAEKKVAKFKYHEQTPKARAGTIEAKEEAEKSLQNIKTELQAFMEEKEKHDTEQTEFLQLEKDLNDKLSVLDRNEAEIKGELSLLAQPVHTRLPMSADSNREPIVLRNLHYLKVDSE
ncbi:hypothetical protein ACMFMG_002247 [Clarireedia jacksonii]